MNELYGCNMYLKIPFETLMDMPVYVRKFWIDKYIADNDDKGKDPNTTSVSGGNINTYAQLEQDNKANAMR